MPEFTGWLLDAFADAQDGLVHWWLCADGSRVRLCQPFAVRFYAGGPFGELRALGQLLKTQHTPLTLRRVERRDLFLPQPRTLLEIETPGPAAQPGLFAAARRAFPALDYYDADISPALRFAAQTGAFPLARCRVIHADGVAQSVQPLETPWSLEGVSAPLRILSIEPDVSPEHAPPSELRLRSSGPHPQDSASYTLPLRPERPLLINLAAILRRHDPDILLTAWGDTWLLPYLIEAGQRLGLPLALNREAQRPVERHEQRSYFAYGQVIYRGQEILLYGRLHIDIYNAMLFHDYGLEGVFEMGRVSSLPLQTAGRASPGSGISAMQILTALRQDILVPWRKQEPEMMKSALDLLVADQGGLVYQPITGLHRDVAAVDFISMYPSIMVRFNISPETIAAGRPGRQRVPELDLWIDSDDPGLVPQTLQPLLEKRIALKARLAELPAWDPQRKPFQAWASAHKWLLVTCFGYLGYKNARFGRIEAHQAVTAYGREALLRAKEAAEQLGFEVLHLYVDGLWVRKPGCSQAGDFQELLQAIAERTSLPVALDGIYRWIAFLPSRQNERLAVPNRYFGLFQDGSFKLRGIELRRHDTCAFLRAIQHELLDVLKQAAGADLSAQLPALYRVLRRRLGELRRTEVPLPDLVMIHKLSRPLEAFRSPSPAGMAAGQLAAIGKRLVPGQHVRFLYIRGAAGVHAWDLPYTPPPAAIDTARYTTLLIRAASTILQPLGVSEARLTDWLIGGAAYLAPPGALPKRSSRLPLFSGIRPGVGARGGGTSLIDVRLQQKSQSLRT